MQSLRAVAVCMDMYKVWSAVQLLITYSLVKDVN